MNYTKAVGYYTNPNYDDKSSLKKWGEAEKSIL